MSRRGGLVVGAVVLAAAAVGVGLAVLGPVADQGVAGGSTTGPAAVSTMAPPGPDDTVPPTTGAATDAPSPDAPAPDVPAPATDAPSPDVPAPAPDSGAEVPPPAPDGEAGPALPPSAPLEPLLRGPVPAAATAEGSIVAGFPGFITPAPDSTVSASMVTSDGPNVQAAFSATSPEAPESVREHFDALFGEVALLPAAAPAVGGSTAWAYSRGSETVTLTLTARADGGCSYSILASLVAV